MSEHAKTIAIQAKVDQLLEDHGIRCLGIMYDPDTNQATVKLCCNAQISEDTFVADDDPAALAVQIEAVAAPWLIETA